MSQDERSFLSLHAVGRSALILTGGAVAVQALGIVRELFLAAQVGATAELDALLIALVLPTALPSILTSGAITALVPAYLDARQQGGPREARLLAGTILWWVGLVGALISVALAVFAGPGVAITGPGLSPSGAAEATGFLQILAPIAFVTAVSSILLAVCQAEQRFLAISVATFAAPATTLGVMLALWPSEGLRGLAIGSLLGPIVMAVILLAAMVRASLVPIPGVRPRGRLGPFLRHAAPLTFGAAILQVNIAVDRAVATLLGPGAVSVLRYADVLVRVPIGAIGPAWGSAIYPALVHSSLGGAAGRFASDVERSLRYVIAVFVPVAILTAAVAPLAVQLAYGRGAFDLGALDATAWVVAGFAPLLLILMASPILTGAHNARRAGRILLAGATLNVILNSTLDVVLGFSIGVLGVALASSIASTIVLAFFTRRLVTADGGLRARPIVRTLAQAIAASLPIGLVAAILCWTDLRPTEFVPGVAVLVAIALAAGPIYLGIATLMGMAEPRTLARVLVDAIMRRGRATPV